MHNLPLYAVTMQTLGVTAQAGSRITCNPAMATFSNASAIRLTSEHARHVSW